MKTEKLPLERFPGIRASISERALVYVCVKLAAVGAAQVNTEYGEVVSYWISYSIDFTTMLRLLYA